MATSPNPICLDYFQFLVNMIDVFGQPEVKGYTEFERRAVLARLAILGRLVSREVIHIIDEVKGAPVKRPEPTDQTALADRVIVQEQMIAALLTKLPNLSDYQQLVTVK